MSTARAAWPRVDIYVGLFILGAWRGRRSPAVLAGALALGILALSGGPDGDSRQRAPLVPIMCVVATAVLVRPASTRGFEQEREGGG